MSKKVLYLECFSGISGDMTVGALLDLGADPEVLKQSLDSLHVDGYEVKIGRSSKCGIDACDFDVLIPDQPEYDEGHMHHHDDDHDHEHHHHDHEEYDHEHHHHHDHEEHEHHHHDGECSCGCGHHHHDHEGHHHADEVFTSWGKETIHTYTKDEVSAILKTLEEDGSYGNVLRAKGMVAGADGEWIYFDMVPEEHEVRTGAPEYTGRICVIGAELNEDKLAELFKVK